MSACLELTSHWQLCLSKLAWGIALSINHLIHLLQNWNQICVQRECLQNIEQLSIQI